MTRPVALLRDARDRLGALGARRARRGPNVRGVVRTPWSRRRRRRRPSAPARRAAERRRSAAAAQSPADDRSPPSVPTRGAQSLCRAVEEAARRTTRAGPRYTLLPAQPGAPAGTAPLPGAPAPAPGPLPGSPCPRVHPHPVSPGARQPGRSPSSCRTRARTATTWWLRRREPHDSAPISFAELAPGGRGSAADADLPAGNYQLWCSLDGHRDAGMNASLRVE